MWLWDLASANYILKLTGHTCRIVSVDWSIDGSTVSAASLDGTILLWALDNKDAWYEFYCFKLFSFFYFHLRKASYLHRLQTCWAVKSDQEKDGRYSFIIWP